MGGNRLCFVHPDDPHCCLKVLKDRGRPKQRRARKGWLGYLRPLTSFDENIQEHRVLERLHRNYPETVTCHLPRSRGMVETDLGPAHAMDLLRDEDGRISQTLEQHLWNRGMDSTARAAIEEFTSDWVKGPQETRELLPHNLLLRINGNGARLFLIDGYGKFRRFPSPSKLWKTGNRSALRKFAERNRTVLARRDSLEEVKPRIHILDRTQ